MNNSKQALAKLKTEMIAEMRMLLPEQTNLIRDESRRDSSVESEIRPRVSEIFFTWFV